MRLPISRARPLSGDLSHFEGIHLYDRPVNVIFQRGALFADLLDLGNHLFCGVRDFIAYNGESESRRSSIEALWYSSSRSPY